MTVSAEKNHDVVVHLGNATVDYSNKKMLTTDDNGNAHFVFKIFQYGIYTYNVELEAAGSSFVSALTVE